MLARRGEMSIATLHDVMGARAARVRQFVLRPDEDDDMLDRIDITFTRLHREAIIEIVAKLHDLPCVVEAEPA